MSIQHDEEEIQKCHEDTIIDEAILKGRDHAFRCVIKLICRREDEEIIFDTPECIYHFKVGLQRRLDLQELFEQCFLEEYRKMSRKLIQVLEIKQRLHEELLRYSQSLVNLKQIGRIYKNHDLFEGELLSQIQTFLNRGPRGIKKINNC